MATAEMGDDEFIEHCRAKHGKTALTNADWSRLLSLAGRTSYAPGAFLCDLAGLRVENERLRSSSAALVVRLEGMEGPLNAACGVARIHGFPYSGQSWADPIQNLKDLLRHNTSPIRKTL